jgi:hypothetical protein
MSDELKERLRANHLDECYDAIAHIETLEAALAAADELAEACDDAFYGVDAVGLQKFYSALQAYREATQ